MRACKRGAIWVAVVLLVIAACEGPESRDDRDDTATPAPTPIQMPTATVEPPTATLPATETPPAPSPTPDGEDAGAGTAESTATENGPLDASVTPGGEGTAEETTTTTPEGTPTATAIALGLEASLPAVEQLPAPGYILANQGTRSALELANSYADSSAHLERLNEWGFKEHHFREFSREPANADDPQPGYVLTTVNEYADAVQAVAVLEWLRTLNASQGHTFVDPPPDIGDATIASSVATAEGTPSSIVFVQIGPRVYAYFAQGGQPQEFCLTLAESNTARILETG